MTERRKPPPRVKPRPRPHNAASSRQDATSLRGTRAATARRPPTTADRLRAPACRGPQTSHAPAPARPGRTERPALRARLLGRARPAHPPPPASAPQGGPAARRPAGGRVGPDGHRPPGELPAGNPRRRMRFLTMASMFVLSIFAAQLVRIQGFDAHAVAEEAQLSGEAAQVIPAMRGTVLASDGTVLASSVVREVVVVDQQAVCTFGTGLHECDPARSAEAVPQAATLLAPLLHTTAAELVPQLTGTSRYRILSRDVTPLTWNTIAEARDPRHLPRPPRDPVRAHVPPGHDDRGPRRIRDLANGEPGGGVELMMEEQLRGAPGRETFELGRDGTVIPVGESTAGAGRRRPGHHPHDQLEPPVVRAERPGAADQGDQGRLRHRRHHGREDRRPAQRRLLPHVRPQHRRGEEGGEARQRRVHGRVRARLDVEGHDHRGRARGGDGHSIDAGHHPEPPAALRQELQGQPRAPDAVPNRRRNARRVEQHRHRPRQRDDDPEDARDVLPQVRPRAPSGTGYPGESRGLLARSEDWSGTTKATVAFGQGLSVTAIQAASVFQTIANDGVRGSPRASSTASRTADGTVTTMPDVAATRVVSQTHRRRRQPDARGRRESGGDGRGGADPGLPGRRQDGHRRLLRRPRPAGYSGRTASFIGYAPADDPQIVVAVIVQKPTYPFFGGYVAGPVFKDVTTYALQELKIPPDRGEAAQGDPRVSPAKALADPTLLRDGRKRSRRVGSVSVAVPRPQHLRRTPVSEIAALVGAPDPRSEVRRHRGHARLTAVLPG